MGAFGKLSSTAMLFCCAGLFACAALAGKEAHPDSGISSQAAMASSRSCRASACR